MRHQNLFQSLQALEAHDRRQKKLQASADRLRRELSDSLQDYWGTWLDVCLVGEGCYRLRRLADGRQIWWPLKPMPPGQVVTGAFCFVQQHPLVWSPSSRMLLPVDDQGIALWLSQEVQLMAKFSQIATLEARVDLPSRRSHFDADTGEFLIVA